MQMRAERKRHHHVIVADDDGDMRSLLAANLRRAGIEVREAIDGKDLVELASRLDTSSDDDLPDLIVTDVHMPGLSGLEALARVKAMWPDVPVVVITAFGDPALHAAAARIGAVKVFDKPFDLFEFRSAVVSLLSY